MADKNERLLVILSFDRVFCALQSCPGSAVSHFSSVFLSLLDALPPWMSALSQGTERSRPKTTQAFKMEFKWTSFSSSTGQTFPKGWWHTAKKDDTQFERLHVRRICMPPDGTSQGVFISSKGIATFFILIVNISSVNIIGNDEFTNVELRRKKEKKIAFCLSHCLSPA